METYTAPAQRMALWATSRAQELFPPASPPPAAIMLSSGIDSLLMAAAIASTGARPLAITVGNSGSEDCRVAHGAAVALNLPSVRLSPRNHADLASELASALDTPDPWHVSTALAFRLVFDEVKRRGLEGPVLNGQGADVWFGGGWSPPEGLSASAREAAWRAYQKRELARLALDEEPIPDFYSLVLGEQDEDRVQFYDGHAGANLAASLTARDLWPEDHDDLWDKVPSREAAIILGVPQDLAYTKKAPLQSSSGLFHALLESAREEAAQRPNAASYSDPRSEDLEVLAVRLWLTGKVS